jgi:hypothetical protein
MNALDIQCKSEGSNENDGCRSGIGAFILRNIPVTGRWKFKNLCGRA